MVRVTPPALAGATASLLLLWLGAWLMIGTPAGAVPAPVAVVLAWLPILPALPAIFRGSRKAAGWCSLVGVFYVGFSVMELAANPASRAWAAVALAISFMMITAQVRMLRNGPSREI